MALATRARLMPLLCLLLAGVWHGTHAAAPNAASIQQQMQIDAPTGMGPPEPRLTVQRTPDGDVAPGIAFTVKSIKIQGNTSIATAQLHALVQDAEGQTITLAELITVVARITNHYQLHGFALSRAIVPGQTIADGVVFVQVIEARYDTIGLDNRSPVSDALLRSALSPLQSGQVLRQGALDQALFTLSDIPGVVVSATMRPGSYPGATDLAITATATSTLTSGSTAFDNYGNSDEGRARLSQTVRVINPFNLETGAALDISGLRADAALSYASVAYETVVRGAATHVGGSYSALQYVLGGALAASGARGEAQVTQAWARHTLLRGYAANMYVQVQYENAQLRDHSGPFVDNNRHTDKITTSLSGNTHEGLGSGALNQWNLRVTYGLVAADDAQADHHGDGLELFTKLSGTFSRLQHLNTMGSLYTAVALQWASRNLDPSEKFTVGGASTVRAAQANALSGDMGAMLNLEYRHNVGAGWGGGNWQLSAFVDCATVQINQTALGASENQAQLNGAGIGLLWTGENQITVKTQLAKLLGPPPSALANETGSVRVWVEVNRTF